MRSRWMAAAMVAAVVLAFMGWMTPARAAALTAARDTVWRSGEAVSLNVASGAVIYAGAIVAVSNVYAYPAADVSGYTVVGMAASTVDNSGAAYKATNAVRVLRGTFRWANGGSFTVANVGDLAYVSDDQTVTTAASASSDIVAGLIIDVDSSGVWVDTYAIGGQGAASFTTVNASGAAALGSTLDVTGNTTVGGTLGVTGATTAGALTTTGTTTLGGTTVSVTNNMTVAGNIQANGNVVGDGASVVTNMAAFGLAGLGYFEALGSTGVVFVTQDGATTNLVTSW